MEEKLKEPKKMYYINKNINPEELKIIKENFEDPNKYLSLDPRIRVGLLPFKSKKSQTNRNILTENLNIFSNNTNEINNKINEKRPKSNIIPNKINIKMENNDTTNNNNDKHFSQQLPTNKINKNRPTTGFSSLTNRKKISSGPILSSARMRPHSTHIHYELKSKDELLKIFSESKERENFSNKIGTNKLLPNFANTKTLENYLYQEKILDLIKKEKIKESRMSQKLSKLCGKSEKNLLYNNIENYRLRRQMVEILEKEKPLNEKFGKHFWMISLRHPKHLENIRINYINVGTDQKEIWKPLLEYPYEPVEIIQNPNNKFIKNKFGNIINEEYFNNETKRLNVKIKNMNEINSLVINGKNLRNEEFNKLNDIYKELETNGNQNRKIRLFKDPFEERKNMINDFKLKENYDKPHIKNCHCKIQSAKTRPKNKIVPKNDDYFY